MLEIALALKCAAHLQRRYEVFSEVPVGSGRADLVARIPAGVESPDGITRDTPQLWIVECKRSLSFQVLAQAYDRRHFAHFVSICVPVPKLRNDAWRFGLEVAQQYGFGVIAIASNGECVRPHNWRFKTPAPAHRDDPLLQWSEKLGADYQKQTPGAPGGACWTEYKQTCRTLREYVEAHPGCTLYEAAFTIKHHYKTNIGAAMVLRMRLNQGVVFGVEADTSAGTTPKLIRLVLSTHGLTALHSRRSGDRSPKSGVPSRKRGRRMKHRRLRRKTARTSRAPRRKRTL